MLKVDKIQSENSETNSYPSWKEKLSGLNWNTLSHNNWPQEFPYTPEVRFQIGHTDDAIVLHFEVNEEYIRAAHILPNSQVWTDSCVEFFLSLDGRQHYYNFEFNVLGAAVIGYGPGIKAERQRLTDEQVLSVSTYSNVIREASGNSWALIFVIPKTIFGDLSITWNNRQAHANFYKCGDELPKPHFISWQPIDHPSPNFHLPQFFGEIVFE